MARMIPANPGDFHRSHAEERIFRALKTLPMDYTVFYSFRWSDPNYYGIVNGEADFIVFHKNYGMIVIEAKSGGIACTSNNWEYIRTDTGEHIVMSKDPLEQADKTKYHLVKFIKPLCRQGEYCQIEPVVWFPSVEKRDVFGSFPSTYNDCNVLFQSTLHCVEAAMLKAYKYYNSEALTNLSQQTFNRIVDNMAPEFHAIPSFRTKFDEQEREFLLLAKEQQLLLDYLEEQPTAVIQGSAGTGKTLLAVEKAKHLSDDGNVLFLCFNKYLVNHLREMFTETNVDCFNLQSLYMSKIRSAELPNDDDISEFLSEYQDFNWQYKHMVIDEGQDFLDEHIEWLSLIAKNNGGFFYVFFDKNQIIQRYALPKWIQNAECRLVLRRNRRNTIKIARTAGKSIAIEPIMSEHSPEGLIPNLHIAANKDELMNILLRIITNYIKSAIASTLKVKLVKNVSD